jgi:hypothetical protein
MSERLIQNPSPAEDSTDSSQRDYSFGGEPVDREFPLECARASVDARRRENEGGESPDSRKEAMAEIYAAARLRHPEFTALEPLMEAIAHAFQPKKDGSINFEEYVECLFVIARHAYFTAPMRDKILLQEAPVSGLKM